MGNTVYVEIEALSNGTIEFSADAVCPCGGGMACCCSCISVDEA